LFCEQLANSVVHAGRSRRCRPPPTLLRTLVIIFIEIEFSILTYVVRLGRLTSFLKLCFWVPPNVLMKYPKKSIIFNSFEFDEMHRYHTHDDDNKLLFIIHWLVFLSQYASLWWCMVNDCKWKHSIAVIIRTTPAIFTIIFS